MAAPPAESAAAESVVRHVGEVAAHEQPVGQRGGGHRKDQADADANGHGTGLGRIGEQPVPGAATSVLIATSHQLDGIGGRYFEDCNQAQPLPADFSPETASGVAPYALDPENAVRLWELSERLIANAY